MKKLNIPLILQPAGSSDCIPTCVLMILQYFGMEESIENLKVDLNYNEVGTTIYDNGALLLDRGFKTTVVTAQPRLFNPETIDKINSKQVELMQVLEEKRENLDQNQRMILDSLIKYINKQGSIDLRIPTFNIIKTFIDIGLPIIALGNAQALGEKEGEYHAVVVTGYDTNKNTVFINNPWPESKMQAEYPIEQFLYFVHCSTCVDIDNGSFLIANQN